MRKQEFNISFGISDQIHVVEVVAEVEAEAVVHIHHAQEAVLIHAVVKAEKVSSNLSIFPNITRN